MNLKIFFTIASLIWTLSCGQQGSPDLTDPDATTSPKKTPVTKRKTYSFNLQMSSLGLSSALHLAPNDAPASAQNFSITLTGCDSTHTATVTNTVATLELYEFDRHCIAKLNNFIFNGRTYTPKSGHDFPNWAVGDTAIFESTSPTPSDELLVTIIETIPAVVTGGGKIHFQFSDITEGAAQTVLESKFRKSQGLTVDGQASPAFSIGDIDLVNIAANGNGEFQFYFDCNQDMTVDSTSGDLFCYSLNLKNIDMTLVEDTYPNNLTESDMLSIFSNNLNKIVSIDMNTDAFSKAANNSLVPHGGFRSAPANDADVLKMGGTKPITTNRDMIVILRSGPYDASDPNVRLSYTYFRINVELITQSGDQ